MNHFLFFYIITIPPYSIFVNRKTSFLTTSFNILLFWMLDVYILTNGKLYPRSIISLLIVLDRKSTRLNSSHVSISYAVFCLKKKKKNKQTICIYHEYST